MGVEEDSEGRAAALVPLPLVDHYLRWIRQVLADLVAPHVPHAQVYSVDQGAALGQYVIAIPRSSMAPHAARRGTHLGYPVRHGTVTVWLSESQVADRYRARHVMARTLTERLGDVRRLGEQRLRRYNSGWLVAALVPEQLGATGIDRGSLRRVTGFYDAWIQSIPDCSIFALDGTRRYAVARGRILIDGVAAGMSDLVSQVELHRDGAGYAGIMIARTVDLQERTGTRSASPIDHDRLEFEMLALISLLANHTNATGAAGDAVVEVVLLSPLHSPTGSPLPLELHTDELRAGSVTVTGMGTGPLPNTRPSALEAPVEVTLPLDAAQDLRELMSAARSISGEVLAEFGLPETPAAAPRPDDRPNSRVFGSPRSVESMGRASRDTSHAMSARRRTWIARGRRPLQGGV